MRFSGKRAVVTGGASGIGRATALRLAEEGAEVWIGDIDEEGGEELASTSNGKIHFRRCDVTNEGDIKALIEAPGELDVLFNNAGAGGAPEKIDEMPADGWDRTQSLLLRSVALGIRYAAPLMAKRGGGAIVNQSSTAAWLYANFYGLAKVGINGLTQQLSRELGGQNIRINAIAPGPIDTEANRTTTPKEIVDDIVKGLPLSRMGTPDDLVGMCLFLLSDEARWITGQIFNVDGGQIIRS